MAANAASEGYHVKHLVDNYPWEALGDGTVVDLGSSQGYVSMAIAAKYPSLNFVVQELPSMRSPSVNAPMPAGFESRVSLTTHGFFDPSTRLRRCVPVLLDHAQPVGRLCDQDPPGSHSSAETRCASPD
jgi:hypothetical protein